MTPSIYTYRALVIDVHDGDTITVDVDLGFNIRQTIPLRLTGINAPELGTVAGTASAAWLRNRLAGSNVIICTTKDRKEKYGRYLASVWVGEERINQSIVKAGHAVEWDGKGARP